MGIDLKKVAGKTLFYDGTDDIFYQEHLFTLENGDVLKFSVRDIIEFADAQKTLDDSVIKLILKECPDIHRNEPIPSIIVFKNNDELPIYFKSTKKYYLVVGLGEYQYGRYKIYIEGAFLKIPLKAIN
jgi:hypothetical protein